MNSGSVFCTSVKDCVMSGLLALTIDERRKYPFALSLRTGGFGAASKRCSLLARCPFLPGMIGGKGNARIDSVNWVGGGEGRRSRGDRGDRTASSYVVS